MIQLKALGVTYPGGTAAIRPTTLSFEVGAFTVLLGSSGAGKSTLLRCLNHLQVPTSGHVETDSLGQLKRASDIRAHRRSTAMIFQQHQLIPQATTLQNVLLGRLGYHGVWRSFWPFPAADRELALAHLDRVGLIDKALEKVANLSGGQQQRVGIARALTQEPSTVLADEPVASLDPASSRNVLGLLRAVCKEQGLTAIVSLHQVEYTIEYADRVIGLKDGAVVFDGPPTGLDSACLARIYDGEDKNNIDVEERENQSRAA